MSETEDHHYVPQFWLKRWCGTDGRLTVFRRIAGCVVANRHAPKHTAYEPNLYTIESLPDDRQWVETNLMSRGVDKRSRPAASGRLPIRHAASLKRDLVAWRRTAC